MTSTKRDEERSAADAKKASRERDALQAVRDYADEQARVEANTARLRALRLEKEAADARAAADRAKQDTPAAGAPKRKRARAHPRTPV